MHEPAQLDDRLVEPGVDFGGAVELACAHREEHQAALQPVVEITRDPPALTVAGIDDASAGFRRRSRGSWRPCDRRDRGSCGERRRCLTV